MIQSDAILHTKLLIFHVIVNKYFSEFFPRWRHIISYFTHHQKVIMFRPTTSPLILERICEIQDRENSMIIKGFDGSEIIRDFLLKISILLDDDEITSIVVI